MRVLCPSAPASPHPTRQTHPRRTGRGQPQREGGRGGSFPPFDLGSTPHSEQMHHVWVRWERDTPTSSKPFPPKEKDRVSSAIEAKGRDPKRKVEKTWSGFEAKKVRWTVHPKRKKARRSFPNQPYGGRIRSMPIVRRKQPWKKREKANCNKVMIPSTIAHGEKWP